MIALASSAGGLGALTHVLGVLPASLPAAVVVVQHMNRRRHSRLAEVLARRTPLTVREATAHERLATGTVFIAPPDLHLLVKSNGFLELTRSAPVHFVRPSADLLFESVAESYGPEAIAVVLSGTGHDGAAGTRAIKRHGGTVIVQNEASSAFFGMPDAAIHSGPVDMVLALDAIPGALLALLGAGATR